MLYKYDNKVFNIPDKEIDKAVEKLDCSIAEACEMYLADHDWIISAVEKELTAKATKNRITSTIHDAKGEKKPRKAREKKENPLKKQIIDIIFTTLQKSLIEHEDFLNINVRNSEKYIDFTIGNRSFTINLVEHRGKKE